TSQTCASLAFLADGRLVSVILGRDQKLPIYAATVQIWDAASGRELLTVSGHARGVLGAAVSPDGRRLAAWIWRQNQPGQLEVWNLDKWRPGEENPPLLTLQPHGRGLS